MNPIWNTTWNIKLNEHNNTSIGLLVLFILWVYATHIVKELFKVEVYCYIVKIDKKIAE